MMKLLKTYVPAIGKVLLKALIYLFISYGVFVFIAGTQKLAEVFPFFSKFADTELLSFISGTYGVFVVFVLIKAVGNERELFVARNDFKILNNYIETLYKITSESKFSRKDVRERIDFLQDQSKPCANINYMPFFTDVTHLLIEALSALKRNYSTIFIVIIVGLLLAVLELVLYFILGHFIY